MYGMNRASLEPIYRRGRLTPAYWDHLHLTRWEEGKFPDEDHIMAYLNTNSTHVNCGQFMAYPGNPTRPWSMAFSRERMYRGVLTIHHLDTVRTRADTGVAPIVCHCLRAHGSASLRWRTTHG